jgi:choice-of-anchor B domain-containing protein
MDDELDESQLGPFPTRTHVWDVRNLDAPVYIGFVEGTASTIDHNLYVRGDYIFEANYTSGLRILKINDPLTLDIPVVGYFDTYDQSNSISFNGAWSNYPFFPSGNIIVSDRQNGLFVVRFNPPPAKSSQAER